MKAVPAIKSQMGSIAYYQTTLTARELIANVRPAKETDQWVGAGIEERQQREINYKRVMEEIVPYLANHPDRFFGSFIVLVEQGSITFEPLEEIVGRIPVAYRDAVGTMGFLTVEAGQHIALDGQHRLIALRSTIESSEELGPLQHQVGSDRVSVIVIEFRDNQTTRRIFSKVNRNAKPTSRSDNILLDEDDGYAIVTRQLIASRSADFDPPLGPIVMNKRSYELVNWRSNTLSKRMRELTTISAVYETVRLILDYEGFTAFSGRSKPVRPSEEELDEAYDSVERWWRALLSGVDAFSRGLADLDGVPAIRFCGEEPYDRHTLLLRPVGQISMMRGLISAMKCADRAGHTLSLEEAIRRVNRIDWSANPAGHWRDVIMRADGKMVARDEAYQLAGELITYFIASEWMDETRRTALWRAWNQARGRTTDEPVDPEKPADPLPATVS